MIPFQIDSVQITNQEQDDKPWRNEESRGLPRLKEENLEKAARSYKATEGVGCDGFHPKVVL